jgi:hypothetical protein
MIANYPLNLVKLLAISLLGLPAWMPSAQAQKAPTETQKPASVWKVFASEAGRFSLLMPGEPIESQNDGVISYSITREKEAVTYTVSFTDFPVDPKTEQNGIQEAFNGIKDGIKEEGGKILLEKTTNLKDFPGEELRVSMPDGMVTRVRSYVVGQRLYLVMASTKNERSLMKSLEGFLNSFRVTEIATSEPVKSESIKPEPTKPEPKTP